MAEPTLRRMVVFMTGYDPAGPDRYYLMLRQQTRYYQRRFGIPLTLTPFQKNQQPDTYFSKTTIKAEWPDGTCLVDYHVADWQDSVLQMAAKPFWKRSFLYIFWYFAAWITGAYPKISKWQKKFLIVYSVPLFFLLTRLFLILAGFGLFYGLCILIKVPAIWGGFLGAFLGGILCYKLHPYFAPFFEDHIAGSIVFQTDLTVRGDKAQEQKSKFFTKEIMADIKASKPDEIIIVGHSCGCFHSIAVYKALLDHVSETDHQPVIIHMTLGSLLPFSIIYKREKTYRKLCEELLSNPQCRWIDFFAPQDPFSVPFADVKEDFSLQLPQNCTSYHEVRSALFGEIFDDKKLRAFRYNPLRMHFQYLAANDTLGDYDFFQMITHPLSVTNNLKPLKNQ